MLDRKHTTSLIATTFVTLSLSVHANDKGLTWTKTGVDDVYGVVDVGCGYTPGVGNQCNPYDGDTACSAVLPVLCFKDTNLQQPTNLVTSSRHQWSGGIVATTPPVAASTFARISDANAFCASKFGPNWRVAEFHDGPTGWYLIAYGNVGDTANESRRRLWVDINDQPNGTCWAR